MNGQATLRLAQGERFRGHSDEMLYYVSPTCGSATAGWGTRNDTSQLYSWGTASACLVVKRRRSEEWDGLAILRLGIGRFWTGERTDCLVDWLVPLASQWPTELLLVHCFELARKAGMTEMQAWYRPNSPHWYLFTERGFRSEPTPLFFAAGLAVPGIDLDDGCGRWYYTMGDSDLV